MMTMRERISRAICLHIQGQDLGTADEDNGEIVMSVAQIDALERACEAAADAVLLELEHPTDAMVEAALVAEHFSINKITAKWMRSAISASNRAAREGK